MIEFKPLNEMQGSASYIAADGDEKLGFAEFTYQGFEMKFTSLECADDSVKEGLMRSAMNYCANRMSYTSTIKAEMLCPAANRLGFTSDKLTVEIPEALASTCCACSK
ncbi:MAG: hypothetical protein MJ121_04735 [Clostridia bacterium]|nr:hypothetical protein [Clostridia bacterium]